MTARHRSIPGILALGLALSAHALAQQHDHGQMDHSQMDHGAPRAARAPDVLATPLPVLTDADRVAAFPTLTRPMEHARELNSLMVIDRLEAWDADHGAGIGWQAQGWFGSDLNRLWLRTEGERQGGRTGAAHVEALYGRSVTPWWDVIAGLRQDFHPGDAQTWAVFGVQGLAPYKFAVQATAYVAESGRTAAQLEIEYELLLTNRLILQPLVELNLFGRDDPARGVSAGLNSVEAGLRLRYEIRRRFAPYFGIVYERTFGDTAARHDTHAVAGLRVWF